MAGQHHRCNEHELGQTPGNGEGQGDLACCSPWGCKESDTTGQLNNNHSSNDAGEEKHTGRDMLVRGLRALTTQVYWFQGTAHLQHYTPSNSFTPSLLPSFLFKIKFIYYLFLAVWGFIAAGGLSLVLESGGCSLAVMHRPLIAMASLPAKPRL